MNGCNHIIHRHTIQSNRFWKVIEVLWWNRSGWKRFTSFKICRCPHILEIVHVNDIYDGRHNPSLILQRTTNDMKLGWQYTDSYSTSISLLQCILKMYLKKTNNTIKPELKSLKVLTLRNVALHCRYESWENPSEIPRKIPLISWASLTHD